MKKSKKTLWKQAIKWPLYSVAVIPIFLSAAYNLNENYKIKILNFFGFTIASILILFWENLTNDLFDSQTGVDEFKFHSILNLVPDRKLLNIIAYISLLIGLLIISIISLTTNIKVLFLVIGCCALGYLYQGPPFRLGYIGLGEPLCWIAFGPLAYSASLMASFPFDSYLLDIPWRNSFLLGSGPSLATTLVLFCSHFHQIKEDKKHGKYSPLVILGTKRSAFLIPWIILIIYSIEFFAIYINFLPSICLLYLISLPYALKLIKLLKISHSNPSFIKNCKFIAIKFQTLNAMGLIIGLLLNFIWNK